MRFQPDRQQPQEDGRDDEKLRPMPPIETLEGTPYKIIEENRARIEEHLPEIEIGRLERIPIQTQGEHGEVEQLILYRAYSDPERGTLELVHLFAHQPYPGHFHNDASGEFYIIAGKGTIILNGKRYDYGPGSTFSVPAGTVHGFEVEEDTLFVSKQNNPILQPDKTLDLHYPH